MRPSVLIGGAAALPALVASALALVTIGLGGGATEVAYAAAKEAGVTKVRTTKHYLIVLNVVPPEHMYPPAIAAKIHPTDGELNIRGTMAPIPPIARPFEAHISPRAPGEPIHGEHPTITVA